MDRALYLEQPWEVSLETFTQCNANCTFCPYSSLPRIGTKMSSAAIRAAIQEMSGFEHPFVFSPFKVNEPFLDIRLREICETFISQCPPHGQLRLFTNGSALTLPTVHWLSALPATRVTHLWVSLNSMNAQDHQTQMRFAVPMWEKIARNLDRIHELKRAGKFALPVVVSRVVNADDHDLGFMRRAAARWPRFMVHLIKRDNWLFDIAAPDRAVPVASCGRWWELSITAEGVAAFCCMDGKAAYPLGNFPSQSLVEIYNNPRFKALRAGTLHRRLAAEPCRSCTY